VSTHAPGEPLLKTSSPTGMSAAHLPMPAGPGKAPSTVLSRRAIPERLRRASPVLADDSWLPSLVAPLTFPPVDRRLMSFRSYVLGASACRRGARTSRT
jgi:hypothetical protein